MSKRKSVMKKNIRASSTTSSGVGFLLSDGAYDTLCVRGYTRLDRVPAIVAGYRRIAELIGSVTIHLMENTDNGDVRISNELSKKIDINPCKRMTRSTWMEYIMMSMFVYGNGNAIVKVKTSDGILDDLQPTPAGRFKFLPDSTGYDYKIIIDGQTFDPDDVLHFVYNPDPEFPWKGRGMKIVLSDLAHNLRQATATEKAFMESPKPSLIVKADGLIDEFSTPEGRKKITDEYISNSDDGRPWVIPANQIDVKEVRPLSLSDIALNDSVKLDTQTVASIIGVPSFVLGVGTYNQKEWNNFVSTKLRPIMVGIQQEMTRKLIIRPQWYLRFNSLSLLDYDLNTIATVYTAMQDRGDVDGNEVRDRIGMSPREGLDELKVLENYIPNDMSGLQNKLNNNSGGKDDE